MRREPGGTLAQRGKGRGRVRTDEVAPETVEHDSDDAAGGGGDLRGG